MKRPAERILRSVANKMKADFEEVTPEASRRNMLPKWERDRLAREGRL